MLRIRQPPTVIQMHDHRTRCLENLVIRTNIINTTFYFTLAMSILPAEPILKCVAVFEIRPT